MVMALFCFTVARARAMFAELLVWFAEPARSCAPHFDGAHFSSMGLSDTGPFKVWAEAAAAKDSRIAARTAERTMECLMDISFPAGVSGREISCRVHEGGPRNRGTSRTASRAPLHRSPPSCGEHHVGVHDGRDAEGTECSTGGDVFFLESSLWLAIWSNTPNFPLALAVPGIFTRRR